ncbi:MAG: FIST N-terminal domain-containing protein [Lautropia sp.]
MSDGGDERPRMHPASPAPFRAAHAVHPQWRKCTEQLLAQLEPDARAHGAAPQATLGIVYIGAPLAQWASDIHLMLKTRTGIIDWVGTVGGSLLAGEVEYRDEPAIVAMIATLPRDSFQVFSGVDRPPPLGTKTPRGADAAWSALAHFDPSMPDVADLVADLAGKLEGSHLFGGLSSGDAPPLPQIGNRTFSGGVSGVVFASDVALRTRVSQGCAALGDTRRISRCEGNLIIELDDRPALDAMLHDLGVAQDVRQSRDGDTLLGAFPAERLRHGLYAGLSAERDSGAMGMSGYRVRNIVGIDPHNRHVAVGETARQGERLVFCTRDARSARLDLVRVATELREEIESEGLAIRGGIYISCATRGQRLFGESGDEAALIRGQLGDFPLIGFFSNGEIDGPTLHGHSGVLTLFV